MLTFLATEKAVLHIGCADWPITNLNQNLHLMLDKVASSLDGVDSATEALEMLRPHVKGSLFSNLADAQSYYDVVLIPEVLEHVGNLEEFLGSVNSINSKDFVFTVPNAFRRPEFFENKADAESFEVVHPDHNDWFSPFTLQNVIQKYTSLKVDKLLSVGGI